jgi:Uma2 family endonuclease
MSSAAPQRLTAAEYLEIERAAEQKSEFFNGKMFAMAGASPEHFLIATNIAHELGNLLRGRPCRVFASDLRVKVSETGLYTYPDVVVVCGEMSLEEPERDTLLNPTLIVEVLSPSTEAYDRGDKFALFRRRASLRQYLLVAQDRPRIERFARQGDTQEWVLTEASDAEGHITLLFPGCDLRLAEVYYQIEFPKDGPSLRPRLE